MKNDSTKWEEEFYELMQTYRHMPLIKQKETAEAYEAVKAYISSAVEQAREEAYQEARKQAHASITALQDLNIEMQKKLSKKPTKAKR